MTAVNAPAIRELAEKGYCIHQISALTGVKLETVRGILRASNQNGQYDQALHLSPTKREPSSSPLFGADYSSLEQRALGHLLHEVLATGKRTPEQKALDFPNLYSGSPAKQWGKPEEAKPVKPKLSPTQYLEISKQIAAALAAKKALEKTKEDVDSINPLTYVQHLEDEDLMYLLQVGMNELQKRYYGKNQTSS